MSGRTVFLLLIAIAFLQSCTVQIGIGSGHDISIPSESGPDPKVYFCPEDNCTRVFLDMIEGSSDIKCALYDLDIPEIIEALKEKKAEVYMEEDNRIEGFGYGNSYALMHNKFCIFDGRTIMTGSFNPTDNGATRNNNNLLIIGSEYLSKNYLDEFDEIKNDIFAKGNNVVYPSIIYNNISIENYFCPEDQCKDHILEELNQANESVYFMFFSFTDKDIAEAFIGMKYKGINVEGVVEKRRINMQYNQYNYLDKNGIRIMPDSNPYIMHHKVFIIDNSTVITGSYNPTKSGNERNDENILIIKDADMAKEYLDEYRRLKSY